MKVEIWSDVVCPWCYIGKRHFETALAAFDHRDQVEVVWRSFELDPSAPAERQGDYAGRLASKYGVPIPEARAMIERMTAAGARCGLELRFDVARPGNTFDAHRLLHLGAERGLQDVLAERLLAATFTEGAPIGDRETLAGLAVEAGLDGDEARSVLTTNRYTTEVRADERATVTYGIDAVPFFLFDDAYGVPGAQRPEVLLEALNLAWSGASGDAVPVGSGASACEGDDVCSV